MNENNQSKKSEDEKIEKTNRGGGMYRGVKISVKALNTIIIVGIIALAVVMIVFAANPGFTVKFDTGGGTEISPIKVMHGEKIVISDPARETYQFDGWYFDARCTIKCDLETFEVTDSLTLYAKWK